MKRILLVTPSKNTDMGMKQMLDMVNYTRVGIAMTSAASMRRSVWESLEHTRALAALLRTQADALRAYWAGGDKAQISRYHEARERAWKGISELLGKYRSNSDCELIRNTLFFQVIERIEQRQERCADQEQHPRAGAQALH